MDYRQARLLLKKGQLQPLYLFSGSDDTLKEELLQEIIGVMQNRGLAPDLLRIDGKKSGWTEVRRELLQVTIFSSGRVLLIKDPPYLSGAAEKGAATADAPVQDELAEILAAGLEDTLLVFSVPNVDRRLKINKYLEKAGVLVEFPPLKGAVLARWIREQLSREGIQIDDQAVNMLVQRCGENLQLLKSELEKLALSLGEEKKITCSHVERLVSENVQVNVFNMVDELGHKNAAEALRYYHKMIRQNEPPLRILAVIAHHFRLLCRAGLLQKEGLTGAKLKSALQVPPFVAEKLLKQLSNFSPATLPGIIYELKNVDLSIKTGQSPGEEALEQLILKLAIKK